MSISQSALNETAILLTFVNRHWSKHLIDRSRDISIHSSILAIHLVQQHVKERAKNKNIQQEIEAMNIRKKSKSDSEIVDWLISSSILRFSIRISSDREWFTSHVAWEVEINEFATASNARMFFAQFWQMQFRKQLHFWSHTNSHYVISQCDDLICFRNDRIRNLQIYTCSRKLFAQILDSDTLFDSQWSLNRFQSADAVKSISSLICLAIDSHRSSRESKRSLSWESIDLKKSQKFFVFRISY